MVEWVNTVLGFSKILQVQSTFGKASTAIFHSCVCLSQADSEKIIGTWIGLPRLHMLMVLFRVFAINIYKSGLPYTGTRASVRRMYAVYYVQKSAAYAEITHQRRTADFWKFLSTAENGYRDVLSAEKTRPYLPDYVIYVPPSCWKLIYFVYWPRKDVPLDWFREFYWQPVSCVGFSRKRNYKSVSSNRCEILHRHILTTALETIRVRRTSSPWAIKWNSLSVLFEVPTWHFDACEITFINSTRLRRN